jgi:hypothetical protein
MSLNPDSIIHFSFQLNILRIRHYLLKENSSSLVKGSFKVLIKMIKFTFFYKLKLLR